MSIDIQQLLGAMVCYISYLFTFYAGNALNVIGRVNLIDLTYKVVHQSSPHVKRLFAKTYDRVASMVNFISNKVKSFSLLK
jgi:hypothetical protein